MDIYKAIAGVMADVGAVGKTDRNEYDKYMYRGIDATMNALHPAMVRNKVFVLPEVLEQTREERTSAKGGLLIYSVAKVKYTFYTVDGSSVSCTVIGEGMDRGDKSMNKAMSAAYKYACFQTFCIPTAEMRDSETDSPEPEPLSVQKITTAHARHIKMMLEDTGTDVKSFLAHYGVPSVDEMTEEQFVDASRILNKKMEKKGGKAS